MLESLLLVAAMNMPIEFERQYVNRAWGYVNQRCLIDTSGQVWFQSTVKEPVRAQQISRAEFKHATVLALETRGERFFAPMVAVDMGDVTWSVRVGDEVTTIQTRGNHSGGPVSLASQELVQMIDSWCEGEPNFPSYVNDRP